MVHDWKEEKKMTKVVYVIVVDVKQEEIDEKGLSDWLKRKRAELSEEFETKKVFIVVV